MFLCVTQAVLFLGKLHSWDSQVTDFFVRVLFAGKGTIHDWRREAERSTSSWARTPGVNASEATCTGD